MPDPVYLDEQGNPTTGPVYLDEHGDPIRPMASHDTKKPNWYDPMPIPGVDAPMPPKKTMADMLPMVGATLATGGLAPEIGLLGRAAAAGLGAAGGEGARQITNAATGGPVEPTGGRILAQMGKTGAIQGAAPQLAGEGIGRILKWAGPKLMDMGLQRTMADRLEFPNTPQRLVDDGIVPRGTNVQDALTRTEGKIGAEAQAYDAAHPPSADPKVMGNQAHGFAMQEGKVSGLGDTPGVEDQEITDLLDRYLASNTRDRTLGETIAQKRSYAARSRYDSRPNAPTATNNELNFNKGVASANRSEAIRMNPAIEGDLAREQDLMGAHIAQTKMDAKSTPLSTIGTLKTMLLMRNPTVMGSAGIAADRTGRVLESPELQALMRAGLLQLMSPHQDDSR